MFAQNGGTFAFRRTNIDDKAQATLYPSLKEGICPPRSTTHFLEVQVHRDMAHTPPQEALLLSLQQDVSCQAVRRPANHSFICSTRISAATVDCQEKQPAASDVSLTCRGVGKSSADKLTSPLLRTRSGVFCGRFFLRRLAPSKEFFIHLTGPGVIRRHPFAGDSRAHVPTSSG